MSTAQYPGIKFDMPSKVTFRSIGHVPGPAEVLEVNQAAPEMREVRKEKGQIHAQVHFTVMFSTLDGTELVSAVYGDDIIIDPSVLDSFKDPSWVIGLFRICYNRFDAAYRADRPILKLGGYDLSAVKAETTIALGAAEVARRHSAILGGVI